MKRTIASICMLALFGMTASCGGGGGGTTPSAVKIELSPADGSANQALNVTVTAKFTNGTVTEGPTKTQFLLLECTDADCKDTAGSSLCSDIQYDNVTQTATCVHGALKASTYYRSEITGFSDASGDPIEDANAIFQTAKSSSDVTATLSPADGSANQALNVAVTAEFSGDIDTKSPSIVFTLKKSGSATDLCTSVDYNETTRVATCNHDLLDVSSTYTITISGVLDKEGKPIETVTSTFTTLTPTLLNVNSLTKDSVTGSSAGQSISITFGFDGVASKAPALTIDGTPVTCELASNGRSCTATLTGLEGCKTYTNYTLALSGEEFNPYTYIMNSADEEFSVATTGLTSYFNTCYTEWEADSEKCVLSTKDNILTSTVKGNGTDRSCYFRKPKTEATTDLAVTIYTTENSPSQTTSDMKSQNNSLSFYKSGSSDNPVEFKNGYFFLTGIVDDRVWLLGDNNGNVLMAKDTAPWVGQNTKYVCLVRKNGTVTAYLDISSDPAGKTFTKIPYSYVDTIIGGKTNTDFDTTGWEVIPGFSAENNWNTDYTVKYRYVRYRVGPFTSDGAVNCPTSY